MLVLLMSMASLLHASDEDASKQAMVLEKKSASQTVLSDQQHAVVFEFDIPSQPLTQSIKALSRQTKTLVLFPYDLVENRHSHPVKGRFTVQGALNEMLKHTGLVGGMSAKGVLMISESKSQGTSATNEGIEMNMKKNILAATIGFFMAGAVGAQDVVSQDDELGWLLEEVVVTASKRSTGESVMDIPMSITAMSGESLRNKGIQNVNDLAYAVPNLSVNELGPGRQNIAIRGISNIQGQGALVGIYVDESPVSVVPLRQLDIRTLDLERVEVLKGPQGTLYGAGAVGGTIRYITNAPSFDGVGGSVGLSAYNTHKGGWSEEVTGVLNVPVVDDVLAFRVAATYEDKAGWIDQPDIDAEDINDQELSHVRIKGLWKPTDELDINMAATSHRGEGGGLNLINFGDSDQSYYRSAVDRDASPGFSHDYDIYNITASYDLGFATLTSASSYVEFDTKDESTSVFFILKALPTGLAERIDYGELTTANVFSQEVRLSSNSEGPVAWTFGAFYSDAEDTLQRTGELKIDRPGLPSLVLPPPPATATRERFSESTALFADITYDITDDFTIGVGTRYFEEDKESDGGSYARNPKKRFDDLSSRVYASYAINENANVYLNIAEGFRSGGFNTDRAVAAGDPADYDPETVITYEAGTKASLADGRLTMELALFLSEYRDYQNLAIAPDLTGFVTSNSAEAEIKGVEWNFQWMALENLSLGFSGNVTDTEYTKIDRLPSVYHEGDQIDYIPEYSYSLNMDYRFQWSEATSGFARLDFNRQGESTATNRGGTFFVEELHSSSVSFLNAQLGAQWDAISLELFADNLLDEDKSPMVAISGLAPQNRPRTLGIKVGYDF